jgi:protein involved in temperature-dependent protein secretion
MAYDARRADVAALAAFSHAIEAAPADAGARFQRGQLYARGGELARARDDLEVVLRSTSPELAPTRALAGQLLGELARGKRTLGELACSRTLGAKCITDTVDAERR